MLNNHIDSLVTVSSYSVCVIAIRVVNERRRRRGGEEELEGEEGGGSA